MPNKQRLLTQIDTWISNIWKNEIKKEYKSWRIQEESVLHTSFYYHLRRKISSHADLFLYSKMRFKNDLSNNRQFHVDLAIVILEKHNGEPKEILSVIEFKHYPRHQNAKGIQNDFQHFQALKKGVYYNYMEAERKLKAKKAYFLYLVEEGNIKLNKQLENKRKKLKKGHYLKCLKGEKNISSEYIFSEWK